LRVMKFGEFSFWAIQGQEGKDASTGNGYRQ
jgi:hypothetical protein